MWARTWEPVRQSITSMRHKLGRLSLNRALLNSEMSSTDVVSNRGRDGVRRSEQGWGCLRLRGGAALNNPSLTEVPRKPEAHDQIFRRGVWRIKVGPTGQKFNGGGGNV